MNSGIIRNTLTTSLALELEYREPSILREIGNESDQPKEPQYSWQLFEDELRTARPDLNCENLQDEEGIRLAESGRRKKA